jgi:hypothetical protein
VAPLLLGGREPIIVLELLPLCAIGTGLSNTPFSQTDDATMVTVGVLALQGSFREHMTLLKRLGVNAIEVGTPGVVRLYMCMCTAALRERERESSDQGSWNRRFARRRSCRDARGSSSRAARAPPWRWWRSAGGWYARRGLLCASSL